MKKIIFENFISIFIICFAALIEAIAVNLFTVPGNFISGGFTGLSILLNEIPLWKIDIGTTMLMLNIPVALFCARYISPRFTFLSLIYVLSASFFIKIIQFPPLFEDKLLLAIFGGVLVGTASTIALQIDASTGGVDFIALYYSKKFQKTFWEYVFVFNAILIVINGYFEGWESIAYSIIFQYVATELREAFHTRYKRITLQIYTKQPEEIINKFIQLSVHGLTCTPGYGGYSKEPITMITCVISSYEQNLIISKLSEVDPHVIINIFPSTKFVGKFIEKEYK